MLTDLELVANAWSVLGGPDGAVRISEGNGKIHLTKQYTINPPASCVLTMMLVVYGPSSTVIAAIMLLYV